MIPLHDDNPTTLRPVVTVGIIAAATAVFLWQITLPEDEQLRVVYGLGLVPAVLFGDRALPSEIAMIPAEATVLTSMFLHGGLLHLVHAIGALVPAVRARQSCLHVAHDGMDLGNQVPRGVGDAQRIRLVVDYRGARPQGRRRVQHVGKQLVLHLDKVHGPPGDLGGLGGCHGHAIPRVAHFRVEAHLIVGLGVGVRLAPRGIHDPRQILVRQHGVHAGQGPGPRRIDPPDPGMGVRTGEQRRV